MFQSLPKGNIKLGSGNQFWLVANTGKICAVCLPGLHLIIFSALNHDSIYSEFWPAKYHDHVENYDDQRKKIQDNLNSLKLF